MRGFGGITTFNPDDRTTPSGERHRTEPTLNDIATSLANDAGRVTMEAGSLPGETDPCTYEESGNSTTRIVGPLKKIGIVCGNQRAWMDQLVHVAKGSSLKLISHPLPTLRTASKMPAQRFVERPPLRAVGMTFV